MVDIKAIRDIQPGEEILASYGDGYWDSLSLWWKRQNPYTCPNCDFRADTKMKLTSHLFYEKTKEENEENGYIHQCNHCVAKFKDKYALKKHVNTHTKEVEYKCNICPFKTYIQSSLYKHKQKHKGMKSKCYICGKLLQDSGDLRQHILNIHEKLRRFSCDIDDCNKTFQKIGGLNNHKRSFHQKLKPYKCNKCEKSYSLKTTLNTHIAAVHEKKTRYKCDREGCDYSSFYKTNIVDHINGVHKTEDRFSCNICDYKTNLKSHFTRHMKYHGEKNFQCDVCDFKGPTQYSLDHHKICHNEKSFVCSICPFKTSFERCLIRHIKRIHDREKRPYSCDICGHAAPLEKSIREHKRLKHSNNKKRNREDEVSDNQNSN